MPGETRDEEQACRQCGAPHRPARAKTGLCPMCRDDVYPPISDRGGKWSPLALGGLSLICDVLLIPSIMAIVRGFRDLGEVARRERDGFYAPEHASVRSGAVWGIVLGALRPMVAVMLLLTMFVGIAATARDHLTPVRGPSELDEVLERIDHDDEATRALAMEHLAAMGPSLSGADAERLLVRAEGALDVPAEAERRVRGRLVASALWAENHVVLGREPARLPTTAPRLAALYPRLDAEGRSAVLSYLAGSGSLGALSRLGELAATDDEAHPAPSLPIDWLAQRGQRADRFLPRLLGSTAHRSEAASLAAGFCRADTGAGLASAREGLMAIWAGAAARPPPGEGWARIEVASHARAREIADALTAMACLDEPGIDGILRAALEDEDPRVAVAGLEGLLRRGRRVSARSFRRLAADPLSRGRLIDATRAHGGFTRIPARWRSLEPVAETDAVPWLVERGRPVAAVSPVATDAPSADGRRDAVLRVEYADGSAEELVVGPYTFAPWLRRPRDVQVRLRAPLHGDDASPPLDDGTPTGRQGGAR